MSKPYEIHVTIMPDGKVVSEVKGVQGPACTDLTKFLENLGVVEVDRHTDDYRKQPQQGLVIKR